MSRSTSIRWGAAAFALAGVLFLAYPAVRPWHDETTVSGATASMSSNAWVAAHFFAMAGFILLPLGLMALTTLTSGTRAHRPASAATVTTWIGAGLTLPYYGAEDFGLHAIAAQPNLVDLAGSVRYNPVAITMFGLGLLTMAAGAVMVAIRLRSVPAILFATGFVLFLPQFFAPPAVRIVHGVLLAVGCVWLASNPKRVEAVLSPA